MTNRELKKHQLGISHRHLDHILCRKRRPSADLAIILEQITGIDRRAWLWPDEFPNPMIKKNGNDKFSRAARPVNPGTRAKHDPAGNHAPSTAADVQDVTDGQ